MTTTHDGMGSLPDPELKERAISGPDQHLAFDELARRIRNNRWVWDRAADGPNTREMEWVCLKWSRQLNEREENPGLAREQEARLVELERDLGEEPESESRKTKHYHEIGACIRKAAEDEVVPKVGDSEPCPVCAEEGQEGTRIWKKRWDSASGVSEGGSLPESGWSEGWICKRDAGHNRGLHEPL